MLVWFLRGRYVVAVVDASVVGLVCLCSYNSGVCRGRSLCESRSLVLLPFFAVFVRGVFDFVGFDAIAGIRYQGG